MKENIRRNRSMYRDFKKGFSYRALAKIHSIDVKTVWEIIQREKDRARTRERMANKFNPV